MSAAAHGSQTLSGDGAADTHGWWGWAAWRAHPVSCLGAVGVSVKQELHHFMRRGIANGIITHFMRRGIANGIMQRQTSELCDEGCGERAG